MMNIKTLFSNLQSKEGFRPMLLFPVSPVHKTTAWGREKSFAYYYIPILITQSQSLWAILFRALLRKSNGTSKGWVLELNNGFLQALMVLLFKLKGIY